MKHWIMTLWPLCRLIRQPSFTEQHIQSQFEPKTIIGRMAVAERNLDATKAALAIANDEILRLQHEVVKRNQYKINQEALDNTHQFYEDRHRDMLALLTKLRDYQDWQHLKGLPSLYTLIGEAKLLLEREKP